MSRLHEIRDEIHELSTKLSALEKERDRLLREEARREYSCPCVEVGKDIGCFTNLDLEVRGRNGLTLGLISGGLSAERGCPNCNGRGKR